MKLLFIHGAGGGREEWMHQTRYFSDAEAITLLGHPEGRLCPSIDDYVEWLRNYINQRRYQDVILVGHSMGGAIAQLYGLRHGDEVKALGLIGTGARMRVLPTMLSALEEMTTDEEAWRKWIEDIYRPADPEVKPVVIAEKIRIGPAVMLNDLLCCDQFDIMNRVHDIKLPVLIVCGSQDDWTPVKYAHYLTTMIEGATEVIIEGAGHWVHLEKPTEVNQAIEKFLGSLS